MTYEACGAPELGDRDQDLFTDDRVATDRHPLDRVQERLLAQEPRRNRQLADVVQTRRY